MKPTTASEVETALEDALLALGKEKAFPCSAKKTGLSCIAQHDDSVDKKTGHNLLWFGTDCRLPETFCASCRAYWHVAVARNCLFEFVRSQRFVKEQDARAILKGEG